MTPEIFNSPLIYVLIVVTTILKGIALWRAANLKQKNWFIAMLVLNLFGVVEILYLVKFAKKPLTIKEIKSWIPSK